MKVATHSGGFHADDVFAIATLRLAGVLTALVRSREPSVLADCDLRVDVGRTYETAKGDFDHHQRGGAGKRSNGVPYASFGLIWKQYGADVAGSAEAAACIDERLVQQVDADDAGYDIFTSTPSGLRPYGVSEIIDNLNPSWQTEPTLEQMDELFDESVEFAVMVLRQEILRARAWLKGRELVREAIRIAHDPRLIIFEHKVPWQAVVTNEAPEALYVIYPVWPRVRNQWSVSAVNKSTNSFETRQPLPETWGGKEGQVLAEITGVEDAVFCHSARFLAIAESKEGALQLAALALGQSNN